MASQEERPPVWVGHVAMTVPDPKASGEYMVRLGMRAIEIADGISILELRGGTHLLLFPGEAADVAPFDLMVEDVDASWARYRDAGLEPSAIVDEQFHRRFTLVEPGGSAITVNSTHVEGVV